MKKRPEISRYGLRLLKPGVRSRAMFEAQSTEEVWHDLLQTLHRRLSAGERVERRVVLLLDEQRGLSKDPKREALIDAVCFALGDDQDIPLVRSKYPAWAEAHAPMLADLLSKVGELLQQTATEVVG